VTYPVIPIRWQRDAPRVVRDDLDLSEHPLAGTPCAHCDGPLDGQDPVAIVAVGPAPDDPAEIERHDEGRWYSADGVLCHDVCAPAFDPATLTRAPVTRR